MANLYESVAPVTFGRVQPGVVYMAAPTIDEMRVRQQELQAASEQLLNAAPDAGPSDDDLATIEANTAEVERLGRLIAARENMERTRAGTGRVTAPEGAAGRPQPGQPQPTVPAMARSNDTRGGFPSFGEFAKAVRVGCIQGNTPDQRLMNAVTTFGNEGVGADGGFLVPSEFAREIMVKVQAEENLLNRAAPLQTGTNSLTIPKDETTPWQSSGGVQVYWDGEGHQITASKPAFETSQLRLVKLTALVPISDENLEDAIGLESWLRAKAPAKMAAKINTGFVRGNGTGMPLGMLSSPSTISVAKEVSQPADTVWFANINTMWARMYAPWRRNAIWLINQDIEPQLDAMAFDPVATSKVPVYLPGGTVANSPYAVLKGRPVVPIEACSTLGDQGDIILVDMQQYWALTKASGIRTDTSIHLYFDQAVTTFRFIFRLNGMPAWSSAITPENGSMTRSWCVTLDERA